MQIRFLLLFAGVLFRLLAISLFFCSREKCKAIRCVTSLFTADFRAKEKIREHRSGEYQKTVRLSGRPPTGRVLARGQAWESECRQEDVNELDKGEVVVFTRALNRSMAGREIPTSGAQSRKLRRARPPE